MIKKEILLTFYCQRGRSMQEIAGDLCCSLNTVVYWMDKYGIKRRSRSEAVYLRSNPNGDPFRIKTVESIEDAKLFGLGVGLYWGEGNRKNKNSIRLGNTNPHLINSFVEFLTVILGVDASRLRFGLQIFTDIPSEKALDFWLKSLEKFSITRSQFFGITVTPSRGVGNYREKSKFGVLTVHFSNSKLKKLLDNMLPL